MVHSPVTNFLKSITQKLKYDELRCSDSCILFITIIFLQESEDEFCKTRSLQVPLIWGFVPALEREDCCGSSATLWEGHGHHNRHALWPSDLYSEKHVKVAGAEGTWGKATSSWFLWLEVQSKFDYCHAVLIFRQRAVQCIQSEKYL